MTMDEFLLIITTQFSTREQIFMTWGILIGFSIAYMVTFGVKRLLLLIEDSFTKKLVPIQFLVVIFFAWIDLLVDLVWFVFQRTVLLTIVFVMYLASLYYADSPDPI